MPYTSLKEQERKKALIQGLRGKKNYAANPLGVLAQGLNAYTAKNKSRELDSAEADNLSIEQNEMNELLKRSSPGFEENRKASMVDALRNAPEDQLIEPGASKDFNYQSPLAQQLSLKSQLDTNAAKQKASIDATSNPSYQFLGTPEGVARGNRRTGEISYQDDRITRSEDDPVLQQSIAAAKARGKGDVETSLIGEQATPTADAAAKKVEAEALARRDADLKITKPKAMTTGRAQLTKTNMLKGNIEDARKAASGWTTGFIGNVMTSIKGSDAYDLSQKLATIKANIGFDRLQEMRNNSVTGGALGQVSEMENKLLQAVWGSLEQAQSKDQFLEILGQVEKQVQESWKRVEMAYELDYNEPLRDSKGMKGVEGGSDQVIEVDW